MNGPLVHTLRILGVAMLSAATFSGCESGQYGSELVARPAPMALPEAADAVLRLPTDAAFSIAVPSSTEKPRLTGPASAECTADRAGKARAEARVDRGGLADAVFQLGHGLENKAAVQTDVDVTVRYRCRFELEAATDRLLADAAVGLRLYARLERGRLLRDVPLIEQTSEVGSAARQSEGEHKLTLTLAPGDIVNIYVGGFAHVETPDDRSAAAMLDLESVEMTLQSRPAPPVRSAAAAP